MFGLHLQNPRAALNSPFHSPRRSRRDTEKRAGLLRSVRLRDLRGEKGRMEKRDVPCIHSRTEASREGREETKETRGLIFSIPLCDLGAAGKRPFGNDVLWKGCATPRNVPSGEGAVFLRQNHG
jgi:hypothetical protein